MGLGAGMRRWTPSTVGGGTTTGRGLGVAGADEVGVSFTLGDTSPCAAAAAASSLSLARLFSLYDLTMLSFSACMLRMLGMTELEGGGAGGISPVMRTRASTQAPSSRRAAMGETLKMSSPRVARCGDETSALLEGGSCRERPGSEAGTGGGGGDSGRLELELLEPVDNGAILRRGEVGTGA